MSASFWLTIVFFLASHRILAQQDMEDVLAFQLLASMKDEESYEFYSERLKELILHPLDLNQVNEENLAYLFFLSPYQIQQLLDYRSFAGPFFSPLELQAIPGFTLETIQLMLPFVQVGTGVSSSKLMNTNWKSNINGSLMSTYSRVLQSQRGYEITDPHRSAYLGSPDRLAIRLRMSIQKYMQLSLNMEKDAGEPFFAYKQRMGFDHYSGSILVRPGKRINKVLVGDYNLQFGQGLWLWTGNRYSAGEGVGQVISHPNGIIPHTGMAESRFMRGVASSVTFGQLMLSPFLAYNQYSATVQQHEDGFVRSINYSGLHRTPSEQRNRKALGQWVMGTHLLFTTGSWKFGTGWSSLFFDKEIRPNTSNNLGYRFQGDQLESFSLDFQYHWKQVLIFGESAHSVGAGFAHYYGLITGLGEKFSIAVSYRDYQKNYLQFFAQSFQEQSNLGNERGLFLVVDYHPSKWMTWSHSIDRMYAPGIRFRAKEPSYGWRFQSQYTYRWHKRGILKLKYQIKSMEENYRSNLQIPEGLAEVTRHQFRVMNQLKLTETWHIAHGFEYKFFSKDAEDDSQGYLIYQDILWKNVWNCFYGNIRFSYFDTSDYNSRIYIYERDVLHAFSFPAYYRKGIRLYSNHRFKVIRNLDFWAKFGWSNYFNEESLGSGLDIIKGPNKSEIKFQIRYSW
ncbi:helix-hairpin-helix domain-containing protein [Sphingobacterium sp. HJSM2_6]|uniref:helix-hairpin-helix domain-containing protein n=1 Tax=Sphingobacterium sp. HJSM2_6 TaxID=3366264 RepID=UPI003BCFF99D